MRTKGKKKIKYFVLYSLFFLFFTSSFSQTKQRITHLSGDSVISCVKVNVSSQGIVDCNLLGGCTETGPYNIGYNLTSHVSGNGSFTFIFTPAVDSVTINVSGISYLDWGKEIVRLYINSQHYQISSGGKSNCDVIASLTSDGDLTGCYPCGTSSWGDITIKGNITELTILDSCAWGYGNGVKASIDIYGKSQPSTILSLGNDTTLCIGETLLLNATNSFATYKWQDNSINSKYTVTKEGTYWVRVTEGCVTKSDTINVSYKNCKCADIELPNVFSPNNDGINEKFPPTLNCNFSQYQLKVFNRWGQLFFQSNNPTISWDGKYNGVLQAIGVYYYLINYQLESEIKRTKSGTITLIR